MHTGVKLFQAKDFFFVLATDNLSWFTDSDVCVGIDSFPARTFSLPYLGEGQEIHVTIGESQTSRCRRWFHGQATSIRHLSYRRKVSVSHRSRAPMDGRHLRRNFCPLEMSSKNIKSWNYPWTILTNSIHGRRRSCVPVSILSASNLSRNHR